MKLLGYVIPIPWSFVFWVVLIALATPSSAFHTTRATTTTTTTTTRGTPTPSYNNNLVHSRDHRKYNMAPAAAKTQRPLNDIPDSIGESLMNYPGIDIIYDGLANKIRSKLAERHRDLPGKEQGMSDEQLWVAVAGGPGSGKSTVSTAVAERLNKDKEIAIVVPMDGWHLTQKDLLDQYGEEQGMRRRGAPWTFDAAKICKDLAKAKMEREGTFPIYCRDISDPVEDGVQLKKTHQVIIVEGLYILWKEDEEWGQLYDLFDERWFIKVPSREEQIRRLVQRSKHNWTPDKEERWGAYPDGARNRAEFNDVKNMDLVSGCEKHADEVIISQSP